MPLISGCTHPNPINGGVLPGVPAAAAAPPLAPAQGDHLFGDVVGTLETAMQAVFGGGALWQRRMQNYSSTLHTLWTGFGGVDYGHGGNPPVVQRNGQPEPDQHSHMFGGYSQRLQWQFCEIVCCGFAAGTEHRRIGGASNGWKTKVLSALDELLNNLVDSTALAFYIATPTVIRAANPATVNHAPISLAAAKTFANSAAGPGKARVVQVLTNYDQLRNTVSGLLTRFDGSTKTLQPMNHTWV